MENRRARLVDMAGMLRDSKNGLIMVRLVADQMEVSPCMLDVDCAVNEINRALVDIETDISNIDFPPETEDMREFAEILAESLNSFTSKKRI